MTDQLDLLLHERLHEALDTLPAQRDWAGTALSRARHIERRRFVLTILGTVAALGAVTAGAIAGLGARTGPAPVRIGDGQITPAAEQHAINAALASAPTCSRVETVTRESVTSDSMAPTLVSGDVVLIVPTASVGRGDIVAFDGASAGNNWPNVRTGTLSDPNATTDFIKRVIGVSGDTVDCPSASSSDPNSCDGVVVNGTKLDESAYAYGTTLSGTPTRSTTATHHFDTVTVAAGQLFVLGDHRDESNDSRFNGPITTTSVRGVVSRILWPLDRARVFTGTTYTSPVSAIVPPSTEARLLDALPTGLLPAEATLGPTATTHACVYEAPSGPEPSLTDDVCFPTQDQASAWATSAQAAAYATYRHDHPTGP